MVLQPLMQATGGGVVGGKEQTWITNFSDRNDGPYGHSKCSIGNTLLPAGGVGEKSFSHWIVGCPKGSTGDPQGPITH